jgi:dolichyl-phosphate-mannose--protein O-mannosyl transferase
VAEPDALPGWNRPATWLVVVLTLVAVGLALFFLPIWLGIPLDSDMVRSRWWFRGWI